MNTENLIPVLTICSTHKIEPEFFKSLSESGLIQLITHEEIIYIPEEKLAETESMIRLYSELGINVEGIEAILHLVQRVKDLQDELTRVKNRLSFYENIY